MKPLTLLESRTDAEGILRRLSPTQPLRAFTTDPCFKPAGFIRLLKKELISRVLAQA